LQNIRDGKYKNHVAYSTNTEDCINTKGEYESGNTTRKVAEITDELV
jgi:hypothetical protein